MKDVMVDLETLATTADSVIMSIGAVIFDIKTGEISDSGFYRSISIESNLEIGRRISEDTLRFWMKQGADAKDVFEENKVSLARGLTDFKEWLPDTPTMWSNGADFDLPMMPLAYTQLGQPIPWKYWNSRCFRTYKKLPGANAVNIPFLGTKHNALADALHQAKTVIAIEAKLFGALQ